MKLLNLPGRAGGPPHFRVLRSLSRPGYSGSRGNIAVYLLETDEKWGAQAVVYKLEADRRESRPLPGDGPAVLWIPHHSSDEDLRKEGLCREFAAGSEPMFTCDYRGIGESIPNTCAPDSFEDIYGSDFFYAGYAEMFGESYVSRRVHDILRTLDFMASFGYDRVHIAAGGWGTIPAALASFLDERVVEVTLHDPPDSWSDMAETKKQQWPFSVMLPGVLEEFDLPDIYRALAGKKLKIIGFAGAQHLFFDRLQPPTKNAYKG